MAIEIGRKKCCPGCSHAMEEAGEREELRTICSQCNRVLERSDKRVLFWEEGERKDFDGIGVA